MAYKYRKPYRVKKKKSILRNRFFWFGILIAVIIFFLFYFLFFSSIFQVKKIVITGAQKVSQDDIKVLIPSQNIFFVDIQKIEKALLENFIQIALVKARKGLPDTLNIFLTERQASAVWCEGEDCSLVDSDGVIFEKVLILSAVEGLIKITGNKEMLDKEKISQILKIQTKLKEEPGIALETAFIASEERLNVRTADGWEIYFNLKGNLDWQLQELELVLEKQIPPECALSKKKGKLEYIDLRFSRVYCK